MVALASCLTAIVAFAGAAAAKPIAARQADATTLYAYGTGISGHPVFFADNYAYIGATGLSDASVQTNVTFAQAARLGALTATSDSSTALPASTELYLIPDSSAPVGFTNADSAAPDGASTTMWYWYGTNLMYAGNGELESYFYASLSSTADVYELLWIEGGTDLEEFVAVVLKTDAPSETTE